MWKVKKIENNYIVCKKLKTDKLMKNGIKKIYEIMHESNNQQEAEAYLNKIRACDVPESLLIVFNTGDKLIINSIDGLWIE